VQYRIFTNDRRPRFGVPMYSCLDIVDASSREVALRKVPKQFDAPNFAPAKAIAWPPTLPEDKAWLKKHVGEPL
jgi:hypothetical protein